MDKSSSKIENPLDFEEVMSEALEEKVMAKLKTLSSKEVTLTKIVDETILGGFILRVGDQQYNASVSNQLNEIKNKFITN